MAAMLFLGAAPAAAADGWRDAFVGSDGRGPEMVSVPGGEFTMGTRPGHPAYEAMTVAHRVTLSGFAIARHEVTVAEFARFLADAAAAPQEARAYLTLDATDGIAWRTDGVHVAPEMASMPATAVTWQGAVAYAGWLAAHTGHAYRLPTEAEWEYAARLNRAGAPGPDLHCGRGDERGALPAAMGRPGALGLRHMAGNVWEWVLDCHRADFYHFAPRRDPRLFDSQCLAPVIRGGSFRDGPVLCNAEYRANFWAGGHPDGIGFRVARELRQVGEGGGRDGG